MPFASRSWRSRLNAMVAAATSLWGGALVAAESATQMSPFKVEAEFGVDGLRIQNSTSVLNPHLLEEHGVAQLQDISGIAPNLFSSNSDSRGFGDILALRGLANSIFFSPPSIALYVDDVPSGSVSSYPSSLLNVENFTIKAGPQGTEYGRNAAAGVIDIKTQAPGTKPQGRVMIEGGSFDLMAFQAAFSGPVTDDVGYSASVGYQERDGYIENRYRNRSADDRRSFFGRGMVYFNAGDGLQFRVGGMTENVRDAAPRLTSLFSPDRFAVFSDHNGKTRLDRNQLSFQARKTYGWGSLIATTALQNFNLNPATTDLDLSPQPLAFSRVLQDEKTWTQEVRVESRPAANQAQWRAGVFFLDTTSDGDALRQFVVPPSMFVPPGFVQTERTIHAIDQMNLAAYGSVDYPLLPKTTLKAGVRLEHADSDITRTKTASNNLGFPSPQDPRLDRSQDSLYGSGTVGIVHGLSDALSVQARTSLAHRPEGFSGFTANPQLARYDSERSWANEIGLTFGPPKGRFGGSVLGFWNFIDDYQFERTVPNSTDFVVVNAPEVESRGVEAKFMWNPMQRLWLDFQAGYTDATFERHRDPSGASVNGKRVPFIPRYTLRAGVTVDFGQGFSGNASYAAFGRTYFDERNTGMFAQGNYGIANAQLRYRFNRFTVTVYGHNLFDEDYYQFINPEIFAGSPGAPQRFGVQVSYAY